LSSLVSTDNLLLTFCTRQYEELRRSVRGTGYGVEAGFFDVVGDKRISNSTSSKSPAWPIMSGPSYRCPDPSTRSISPTTWVCSNLPMVLPST